MLYVAERNLWAKILAQTILRDGVCIQLVHTCISVVFDLGMVRRDAMRYLILGLVYWPWFSLDWQTVVTERVCATLTALIPGAFCYYTPVYSLYQSFHSFCLIRGSRWWWPLIRCLIQLILLLLCYQLYVCLFCEINWTHVCLTLPFSIVLSSLWWWKQMTSLM